MIRGMIVAGLLSLGACSTSDPDIDYPREPDDVAPDYTFSVDDAVDVIMLEYYESSWDEIAYVHGLRERGYLNKWLLSALWVARNTGIGLHDVVWEHEGDGTGFQELLDRERVGIRRLFLNIMEGEDVPPALVDAYQVYWARGYLRLSDAEIQSLVRMRIMSDYFGSTPEEAVANEPDIDAFVGNNYTLSGAGGRTATGRMLEEGPRPWNPTTRSTWNMERSRVHMDR